MARTALLIAALLMCLPLTARGEAPEAGWYEALRKGDVAQLKQMLGTVEDPDTGADSGRTALMVAAQSGDPELVKELLAAGAEVNAENPNGGTPLMYAAAGGNPDVVDRLVAAGAELEARASLGWTALLVASAKGRTEAVAELLAAGANCNARDVYGWTPLMRAVDGHYLDTARVLLEQGHVDVNNQEESGNTALHLAAADGDVETIRLLLEHGARPDIANYMGMTAEAVARTRGHTRAARLVKAPTSGG
ncbi:MAG: ankyrin repeat domain-containing protein [Gammaproteobacteria bacterium]